MKNDHQAPPALLCLCQKNFLLPLDSIFAYQDIWEIQCEKMVAYAQALQFWAEKADLPTGGKPHLLAGSIVELREEMKCYISFSDEDVFDSISLLEETPIITPEEATTESTSPTLANPPVKEANHGHDHGACCGEEASKQVPWLGESATPLQTHSCHWADSPFIKRPKAKASHQEFGGRAGLTPSN